MNKKFLEKKFLEMLSEDTGTDILTGDITSSLLLPQKKKTIKAKIIYKSTKNAILSGISELLILFSLFKIKVLKNKRDGEKIKKGETIFILKGNPRRMLLIERTALNVLSRMSAISTSTNAFVLKGRSVNKKLKIAATRKTTPLFSYFEKRAVKIGGGDTHRLGLWDEVMLKDNHLKVFKRGNIKKALTLAKKKASFAHKIEIEVSNKSQAIEAAKCKADIIMLDNFSTKEINETIKELKRISLRDKVTIEASGGIKLTNVKDYAKTGVDVISVGALTHSIKSLDFSLEVL